MLDWFSVLPMAYVVVGQHEHADCMHDTKVQHGQAGTLKCAASPGIFC